MTARVQHLEWRLRARPHQLWPYVSDTERLNQALGLPPVIWTDERTPTGYRRFGEFTYLGMRIRWEEKAYEWIEGEQLGVERLYETGPIVRLRSFVRLAVDDAGTLLQHSLEYEPRSLVATPVAGVEFVLKVPRNLERVYRGIDAHLAGEASVPFPSTARFSRSAIRRLEHLARRLTTGEGIAPSVAERITDHVRTTDDLSAARMRPFELADRWKLERAAVLRAFVRGAALGVFVLGWDIVCPSCRGARVRLEELKALGEEAHCASCDVRIDTRADRALELVFAPSPAVRKTDRGTYCIGGPGNTPHVVFQRRLAPGERARVAAQLVPGTYRVRGPGVTRPALVEVAAGRPVTPVRLAVAAEAIAPDALQAGPALDLELANADDRERVLLLERARWIEDAVTPAQAFASGELARAFPAQLPPPSLAVSGGRLAVLAFAVACDEGDLEPDERVFARRELSALVEEVARAHGGGPGSTEGGLPPGTHVLLFTEGRSAFEAAGALLAAVPLHAHRRDLPPVTARAALDASPCFVASGQGRPLVRGDAPANLLSLLGIAGPGELIVGAALANELGEPPEGVLRCSAGRGHVRFASALKLPPRAPTAGIAFEDLELAEVFGEGRHSRVRRARHKKDGRSLAVKLLPASEVRSRARFDREIAALARLRGVPGVVAAHGHGALREDLWIALDLVEGPSLEERLRERGRHSPAEAAALLAPVARALHAAHGRGVLHRDVKPANIVIDAGGVPWLIDFGVAALEKADRPAPGTVSGTFPYLAPEAFDREPELDARADVYALGITFYELVAGERPFGDAAGEELIVKILSESAPALGGGEAATRVARHALRKRREERYASAAEMATDLDLVAQGKEPVFAPLPEDASETTRRFGTRLFKRALDAIRGKKPDEET